MADACCDTILGGLINITWDGKIFEAIGDVVIEPAAVEREAQMTAGGKLYVTESASARRAIITFANFCGENDPMQLWNARCNIDVTVSAISRGIGYLLTKATMVGKPSINLANGEVSGMEVVTHNYAQV